MGMGIPLGPVRDTVVAAAGAVKDKTHWEFVELALTSNPTQCMFASAFGFLPQAYRLVIA